MGVDRIQPSDRWPVADEPDPSFERVRKSLLAIEEERDSPSSPNNVTDEPRCTTAMKKHNHSSDDHLIQYRGEYPRHSRGQALTDFASDRHTGAKCLKLPRRTIEALAPAPSPLVSLFLN
jgi:hypothetical protein